MPRTPPQYGCYALTYRNRPTDSARTILFFPNVVLANIEADLIGLDCEPAIAHWPTPTLEMLHT